MLLELRQPHHLLQKNDKSRAEPQEIFRPSILPILTIRVDADDMLEYLNLLTESRRYYYVINIITIVIPLLHVPLLPPKIVPPVTPTQIIRINKQSVRFSSIDRKGCSGSQERDLY